VTIPARMTSRLVLFCLSLLVLTLSSSVSAQGETPREQARAIGEEGLTKYDAGDFKGALEKLDRAYALYPAPTLGLYSARALVKLGRLLEGSRRYLEVSRATLEADATEQLKQAQADATAEHGVLEKRIPVLRVEVTNAAMNEVAITLNGTPVASSELSQGRRLDPGKYAVQGVYGSETKQTDVVLRESEQKTAVLQFTPPAVVTPPPAGVVETAPPPAPKDQGKPKAGSSQRTLGWVVLTLGGIGVGVGAVTGIMASGKKSDLEKVCPDLGHCPESSRGDVDSYNNLRTFSSIGFIGGGVGVAAGLVLVLTAPKSPPAEARRRVQPFVGLGTAGVRGAF
jgi:hypothetical protein